MKLKNWLAGLLIIIAFAVIIPFASQSPDGLEKVAVDMGFAHRETGLRAIPAPLAGYTVPGIGNEKLSAVVSAILGSLAVFGAGWGIAILFNKRKNT